MARIICPARGVDHDEGEFRPGARVHRVTRRTELACDGPASSTQLIPIASGIRLRGCRSLALVVRLHEKSTWTLAAGSSTTLNVTFRAEEIAYADDDPGRTFVSTVRVTSNPITASTVAPWISTSFAVSGVLSDSLRVVAVLAQGAIASDKLQTLRVSVDLVLRPDLSR
jgi:hypothetical protein